MLLAILPISVLLVLIVAVASVYPEKGWRAAVLRAAVIWGTYLVLLTEILSFGKALTRIGLSIGWGLPLFLIMSFLIMRVRRGDSISIPRPTLPEGALNRLIIVGVVLILTLTGSLAWIAPPQTWDSLNYHMPRVAHWAQQQAVRHYPTGVVTQNYMSPGAGYVVLQFYVLSASDRFSNFVEWGAMVGSLIGVSSIFLKLGGDKKKQLVAVLLAVTLPMGIVQASSVMTDYVVAFWMVIVAAESLSLMREEEDRYTIPIMALSAGLTVLSKPTGFAYALPFAILVAIILVRRYRFLHFLRYTVITIALVLVLNIGHLVRNYSVYGNPFGTSRRISSLITEEISIPIIISNTLRNASLHAGTPSPHVNKGIYLTVVKLHEIIGIDPMDSRTTHSRKYRVFPPSTHEDLTTNPVHAYFYLIIFVIFLFRRKRYPRNILLYGLIVPCTFITVSTLAQWQLWNGRMHLGFFVLFAPVAAYVFIEALSSRMVFAVSFLFLIASFPWLLQIRSRPLIYNRNTSYTLEAYKTPRTEQYYVNGGHLVKPHKEMTDRILDADCKDVGIALPGNDAEYPLWMLLDAPFSGIRIEWLVKDPAANIYPDPDFQPCAVILRPCAEDKQEMNGLPRVYKHKATEFCLFLES